MNASSLSVPPSPSPPSNFVPLNEEKPACTGCSPAESLPFKFGFAYQPIVDLASHTVYAHEALVRGPAGETAGSVLAKVNDHNRYRFDQACRVKAIKGAAEIGIREKLSINFLPNAIYKPEVCIRTTLEAARATDFPVERIIFETTEGDRVDDAKWLAEVMREYKRCGFLTAIDDFGAGYAGLTLLADFQPDLIKLDMALVRGIDTSAPRQAIVSGLVKTCSDLGIRIVGEGVETAGERDFLYATGITLQQGFLYSWPMFQARGEINPVAWMA